MNPTPALVATAFLAIMIAAPGGASAQAAPAEMPRTVQEEAIDPLVARWAAAWNDADAEAMTDLFAPGAIYEDLAFQVVVAGPEGVAQWVSITSEAIPDAHVRVEEVFRTSDRIAVRWTFTGTPEAVGEIEASGESFSVPVVTLMELDGDRIARVTDAYNLADVLRQIGLPAGPWTPPAQQGADVDRETDHD